MNDTAIKNYCMWARRELIAGVQAKAHYYGIREDGYEPAAVEVLHGEVVLTPEEHKQREGLIQLYESKDKNYEAFIEQAAYTWFNRIMAIRFMELNDRLPSHTRMFSFNDGSFGSQAVKEALDNQIEGVDQTRVIEYKQASDDEALFRYLFLEQCNELSTCMPQVFDPVGSALELLLPDGLLRRGSVIERMVADIPEEDWREGVEIVGWMYQYYNAERKREVFDGYQEGKKAEQNDIAPATQIFSPKWMVHYMVDNSLGHLWMLSHPDSKLTKHMDFYIEPGVDSVEEFRKVDSPEEITVCDPACGSGHILVYAFDLLALMYEEAGYSHRDIPRLILENNLKGFEIDLRAAEIACFALTMKGCEWDRRFLKRGVQPKITLLQSVVFEAEELELLPELKGEKKLLDTLAHLDECGSLFLPTDKELDVLYESQEKLRIKASLFSGKAEEKIKIALTSCEQLQKKHSIAVTNPPYMGSSNMNKWLANYTKKHFPDTKRDLCTCFIERCVVMLGNSGYAGLMTTNSWMFLSTFEKLRQSLLANNTLSSLVQLSVHGFKGIAAQICTFVIAKNHSQNALGSFIRLDDFDHHSLQESKTKEAIDNPDCGWFYRRRAEDFKVIPGSPIAYWVSEAMMDAFIRSTLIKDKISTRQGNATTNNAKYLRLWHEVSCRLIEFDSSCLANARKSNARWFPYNKGGSFRKWYGNYDYLIDLFTESREDQPEFTVPNNPYYFKQSITWSDISSGLPSFRFRKRGSVFDVTGMSLFPGDNLLYFLGIYNSSVANAFLSILAPTLHCQIGDIQKLPLVVTENLDEKNYVSALIKESIALSRADYDCSETSWDFEHHPLV